MKTLIGIPTFGGLPFTKLCVKGIRDTVQRDYDLFAVVGKPGDDETAGWLTSEGIAHSRHDVNLGLPAALNDIYDCFRGYDAIVIIGNDVIPYPRAIDILIETALATDWEWICSSQFDVQTLCKLYHHAGKHFTKGTYVFDFQGEPWKYHEPAVAAEPAIIVPGALKDVHNLCLYKRSAFEKIGYVDVNFFPAYFEDNDFARRAVNAGVQYCSVNHSQYFHFWSRTIHQSGGGSTNAQFNRNAQFYVTKWGGTFGQEKWSIPFDGKPHTLPNGVVLPGTLKIESRDHEREIAEYWRGLK